MTEEQMDKILERLAELERRIVDRMPSLQFTPSESWVHPACRQCVGKLCNNAACPSRPVIT